MKQKNKKKIIIIFVFITFLLLTFFLLKSPLITGPILKRISEIALNKYNVSIDIEHISLFSFSGTVLIKGIKIKFLDFEPEKSNHDIFINKIAVSLEFFSFILKKIKIKQIYLDGIDLRLIVENKEVKNVKLPHEKTSNTINLQKKLKDQGEKVIGFEKNLFGFEVGKIKFDNFKIFGKIDENDFALSASSDILLKDLFPSNVDIYFHDLDFPKIDKNLNLKSMNLKYDEKKNVLHAFINFEGSHFSIEGNAYNLKDFSNFEFSGNLSFKVQSELLLLNYGFNSNANISGKSTMVFKNKILSFPKFKISGQNLENNYFSILDFDANGNFNKKTITLESSEVNIGGAKILLIGSILLDDNFGVKGKIKTLDQNFSLKKVYNSLGTTPPDVDLNAYGDIDFDGKFSPFLLNLKPDLFIFNTNFKSNKDKISIMPHRFSGNLRLNSEEIICDPIYLIDPDDSGKKHEIKGKIIYDHGLENMVLNVNGFGLNKIKITGFDDFSGELTLKSHISGDFLKPKGVVDVKLIKTRYGSLDLPDFTGTIRSDGLIHSLKKGKIKHKDNNISLEVVVDDKDFKASAKSNKLNLEEFSKIKGVPYFKDLTGVLKFNIDLSKKNDEFEVYANIDVARLGILGERINKIDAILTNRDRVKSSVRVQKGTSIFEINGDMEKGALNYLLKSNNLKLEDFNSIPDVISGDTDLNGKIVGTYDNPNINLNIKIKNTKIRSTNFPESEIDVAYKDKKLIISSNFLGENASFFINYENEKYYYKILFNKFDLAPILLILSHSYSNTKAFLEAEIEISNDYIRGVLTSFYAEKDRFNLGLDEKVFFSYQNKKINLTPLKISGNGVNLYLAKEEKLINQRDEFALRSNFDLNIIYPLLPGITHAKGRVSYSARASYDNSRGEFKDVFGKGSFEDISIGVVEISQLFENINGNLFHDDKKISFEKIQCQLGGGEIYFLGEVGFVNKVSSNIKVYVDNVNLNYKDYFRSTIGSDIRITGNGLPLNIKGKIDIPMILYTKDFNYKSSIRQTLRGRKTYSIQNITKKNKLFNFDLDIYGRDMAINNNLGNVLFKARVRLKGDNTKPIVLGSVESQSGFLLFKNRKHNVENVRVEFTGHDLIDPVFNIDTTSDFKTHMVMMNIRGSYLGETKINLSSKPPLDNKRILLLLSTGSAEGTDEDLARVQAFDIFLEVDEVTSFAEKLTGVDRIYIAPGSIAGQTQKRGNILLTAEKDLSDSMVLKFTSTEDFTAYKFNLDYHLSPNYRIEAGKETEENYSSNSVDLIWEKSYK